jgi:hypothetical protein
MSVRIFPRPLGGLLTTLFRSLTAHCPVRAHHHAVHDDTLRAGQFDQEPRPFTPWEHLLR